MPPLTGVDERPHRQVALGAQRSSTPVKGGIARAPGSTQRWGGTGSPVHRWWSRAIPREDNGRTSCSRWLPSHVPSGPHEDATWSPHGSLMEVLGALSLLRFSKQLLPHRQAIRCSVVVNLLEFLA